MTELVIFKLPKLFKKLLEVKYLFELDFGDSKTSMEQNNFLVKNY